MYYSNVKQEIIWGYTHIDFDGDPPQDVLDYMEKIGEYGDLKFSLKSLFRKIENNYGERAAEYWLNRLELIPSLTPDDFTNNIAIFEALQDIQKNNPEQMLLITKCNADRLLLRN